MTVYSFARQGVVGPTILTVPLVRPTHARMRASAAVGPTLAAALLETSSAVRAAAPPASPRVKPTLTSVFRDRGELPTYDLGRSPFRGGNEAAEVVGNPADRFLVSLLREPQAVPVLAVGLDHPVDVLPRLPVRIRRLRHR